MLRYCKVCGQEERDHHYFEPAMQDGCECAPHNFYDRPGHEAPPICGDYVVFKGESASVCSRCGHGLNCHRNINAQRVAA